MFVIIKKSLLTGGKKTTFTSTDCHTTDLQDILFLFKVIFNIWRLKENHCKARVGVRNLHNMSQRTDTTIHNCNQVQNVTNYLTCMCLSRGRKAHTCKRLPAYINPQPAEDSNSDMTQLREHLLGNKLTD